jgi:hypothetical protein
LADDETADTFHFLHPDGVSESRTSIRISSSRSSIR